MDDMLDREPLEERAEEGNDTQQKKQRVNTMNAWWLNADPDIWSLSKWPVGAKQSYTLCGDNGHKRRVYKNFINAKPGDVVIGYESSPTRKIVAIAKVFAEQDGTEIVFEKVESLSAPVPYVNLKNRPELANMEFFKNPRGSLFKLTPKEFHFIMNMIRKNNPAPNPVSNPAPNPAPAAKPVEAYTAEDFLREVYISREDYEDLTEVLRLKKNLILQGPPGVGKTFAAKRLAWAMMGRKDEGRVAFVQFHQNYSYEDFVMGYKPAEDGFELRDGIFYQFCQEAGDEPGQEYFFIIDEINRGNTSKIFGELLMLIEKDYRGTELTLSYNGQPFKVPENLCIIGMMNTADRSLAMIDYALRRRFAFFEMKPGFDSDGFVQYQSALGSPRFDALIDCVKALNEEIIRDASLGKGFAIGHSYFCGWEACTDQRLRLTVKHDILPMLEEYWFDAPEKVERWAQKLNGALK